MIIYIIIMDETTYSQILHFYSSSDSKYPQYIYDVPLDKRVDAKSNSDSLQSPTMLRVALLSMVIKKF